MFILHFALSPRSHWVGLLANLSHKDGLSWLWSSDREVVVKRYMYKICSFNPHWAKAFFEPHQLFFALIIHYLVIFVLYVDCHILV